MNKIQDISLYELKKDKEESRIDIIVCEQAIKDGIKSYSGGLVKERLEINKKIVEKINKEILRRFSPSEEANMI